MILYRSLQILTYVVVIEYDRVDIWGFFKRPELEMVKLLVVVIKIMNDVLRRGREGVFALIRMLI